MHARAHAHTHTNRHLLSPTHNQHIHSCISHSLHRAFPPSRPFHSLHINHHHHPPARHSQQLVPSWSSYRSQGGERELQPGIGRRQSASYSLSNSTTATGAKGLELRKQSFGSGRTHRFEHKGYTFTNRHPCVPLLCLIEMTSCSSWAGICDEGVREAS